MPELRENVALDSNTETISAILRMAFFFSRDFLTASRQLSSILRVSGFRPLQAGYFPVSSEILG